MPWHIARSDACPADKPFAVINETNGFIEACHVSEAHARGQLAALYASEPEVHAMIEIVRKAFTPIEFKLSETGDIELAFSRLNVIDSDGDVTLPGAFPTKEVPMSAYGHTSWDGALPIGKGSISEQAGLGVFKGSFFMQTTHGRDAYETVKGLGSLAEFSYGYKVTDGGPGTFDGQRVRELRKLDVFEVSPVLKGAGVGTGTLAIKSGGPGPDAPYAEHLDWVLAEVKALMDRSRDRADWRAKEGRVMSAANLARLASVREAMGPMMDDLDLMIAEMSPPKAMADAVTLDVLFSTAKRLGVLV